MGKSKQRQWDDSIEKDSQRRAIQQDIGIHDDFIELGDIEGRAKILLEDAKTAVAKLYQKTNRRSRFDKLPRKVNDWQ